VDVDSRIAAVTMLAACLLLLVLLYIASGQSGLFSDEAMTIHSGGGSKPVAMAIQGAAVRGVGPLNKEVTSNNIRSKQKGRSKKKQNRLAIGRYNVTK
jgi:hypothetical protein